MELGVSHVQNLSSLPPVVDNIFDKYNKNLVPIRSLSDHDIGKAFDEVPIVTYKTHKRLHFSVSVRGWTLSDRFQVLFRRENTFPAHMMSQVIDLRFENLTLRRLQLEAVFM